MTRTAAQIRRDFLEFFRARQHALWPGAPVVPHDDPTLLFTNAGMNQFKPLFLGTADRAGEFGRLRRAANSQPCIRAGGKHNDLDDVGHDTYHHTFFEMLGNWSFGDYFKREAIEWAWELVTKVWGLDPQRLHATYFGGDEAEGVPPDHEARDLWASMPGMARERIHPGSKKDNFWEMGDTGPCGPCSEIHIDLTPDKSGAGLVNAGDERVIEFWNLVFIQFNRGADGKLTPLPAKHVDTGMGFERIVRLIQGQRSNYDIDVFTPIFDAIRRVSGAPRYGGVFESDVGPGSAGVSPFLSLSGTGVSPVSARGSDQERSGRPHQPRGTAPTHADALRDTAYRVIADHIRTLTFAISDGCPPDKDGRGYVLRRILRRAVRYGWQYLELHKPFLCEIAPTVVEVMGEAFPTLKKNPERVVEVLREEEESFERTLGRGIALFEEAASRASAPNPDREGAGSEPNRDRERAGSEPNRDLSSPLPHGCGSVSTPAAYFITFHTYGTWLHGREEGSVDDEHNIPGEPLLDAQRGLEQYARDEMRNPPFTLDAAQRGVVERTLREVAEHRGWEICALHVRTNHVHVVIRAESAPERVMGDFKAYATRRLREAGLVGDDADVWARHGSTRYLWEEQAVARACEYALEGQGAPLRSDGGPNPLPHGRGSDSGSPNPLPHGRGSDSGSPNPLPYGRGSDSGSEGGMISGADAFKLHDTYGFPIDLTQIMAAERGLRVDIAEYERLMEEARERARKKVGEIDWNERLSNFAQRHAGSTKFVGYGDIRTPATAQIAVEGVMSDSGVQSLGGLAVGERGWVVLDQTPFYAEMGGQVGDTGTIEGAGGDWEFEVEDTVAHWGAILHRGTCKRGRVRASVSGTAVGSRAEGAKLPKPKTSAWVTCSARVDPGRRLRIMQNHTATHILNWALREVLDRTPDGGYADQLQQKGSLVDPDKTRFDFSHGRPLAADELTRIEELCRQQIDANLPVFADEAPQADARKINGLRAVFGEKYPDRVRVVAIGKSIQQLLADPGNAKWRGVSIEFCGGTHVNTTKQIEAFAIVSEEAVARGIRRVVGITGQAAADAVARGAELLARAEALADAPPEKLAAELAAIQKELESATLRVVDRIKLRELLAGAQQRQKEQAKQQSKASAGAARDAVADLLAAGEADGRIVRAGGTAIVVADLGEMSVDQLKTAADMIKQKLGSAAVLLAARTPNPEPEGGGKELPPPAAPDGKPLLLAAMSPDLAQRGVKAGDLVKQIAPLIGGGGGGPPTMAQAGGKNAAGLPDALAAGARWLRDRLG